MAGSDAEYSVTCSSGPAVPGGAWITPQAADDLARDVSAQAGHECCLHQVHRLLEPVPAISTYFLGHAVTGAERPRYDVRRGSEAIASFPGGPRGMGAAWAGVAEMLAVRGTNGVHVMAVDEHGAETLELGELAGSPAARRRRS